MELSAASKFTYRLGTGLKAGVDVVRALESESTLGSAKHRSAMLKLHQGTKQGFALSHIMQNDPYFPRLMTAITRVGEETGKIEEALLILSKHYDHQVSTKRAFLSSIAWPALQLIAGIGVISLLIYLMGILTPAGGGQMIDILGLGLRGGEGVLWFWFYIAVVFGVIGLLIFGFSKNFAGVQNLIPLIYKIPIFGPSVQTITITRLCWTLSLTLGSGIDPIRSIRLALDSTDSEYYQSGADKSEHAIRAGASLAEALQATEVLPKEFVQRVDIAEHAGSDAEAMAQLSREYDERSKQAIKVLTGIATVLIRVTVAFLLIYFIFKIASVYLNALDVDAVDMNPHRAF